MSDSSETAPLSPATRLKRDFEQLLRDASLGEEDVADSDSFQAGEALGRMALNPTSPSSASEFAAGLRAADNAVPRDLNSHLQQDCSFAAGANAPSCSINAHKTSAGKIGVRRVGINEIHTPSGQSRRTETMYADVMGNVGAVVEDKDGIAAYKYDADSGDEMTGTIAHTKDKTGLARTIAVASPVMQSGAISVPEEVIFHQKLAEGQMNGLSNMATSAQSYNPSPSPSMTIGDTPYTYTGPPIDESSIHPTMGQIFDDLALEERVLAANAPHLTKRDILLQVYAAHQQWLSMKLGLTHELERLMNFNLALDLKHFIDWLAENGIPVDSMLGQDMKLKSCLTNCQNEGVSITPANQRIVASRIQRDLGLDPKSAHLLVKSIQPEDTRPELSTQHYHAFLESLPTNVLDLHSQEVGLRGKYAKSQHPQIITMDGLKQAKGMFPTPGKPISETIFSLFNLIPVRAEHLAPATAPIIFQR